MPKQPVVSAKELIKVMAKLGYEIERQKGSHIRLRKTTAVGVHNVTIPEHKTVAKGTLNDILTKVSLWNNISKEDLVNML